MSPAVLRVAVLAACAGSSLFAQAPRGAGAKAPLPGEPPPAAVLAVPELLVDAPTPERTIAVGRGFKAIVEADGLEFVAFPGPELPSQPLALRLQGVRIGDESVPLAPAHKLVDADRPAGDRVATLDHGGLREHFALRATGVEQSWSFATLPRRGELELALAVTTTLAGAPRDGGVRFGGDAPGCVQYGSATAIDAEGRRTTLVPRLVDGTVRLTVPAEFVARATLPLLVDPLISAPSTVVSVTSVATGVGASASYDAGNSRYLVVWTHTVSATDRDVYARRCNSSWVPVGSTIVVDASTQDWVNPSVAHRGNTDEWLVVASVARTTAPTGFDVRARRMPFSGTPPAPFPVGGFTGTVTATAPVVGGDPYQGLGSSWFLVGWRDPFGVHVRTVDAAGVVATTATFLGSVNAVAVARSNRSDRWLLAWREGTSVRGALCSYDGAPIQVAGSNTFPIGTAASSVGDLSVSAPDRNGRFSVAWTSGADVLLASVTTAGVVGAVGSVAALDPPAGGTPRLETDGVRGCLLTGSANTLTARLVAYDEGAAAWEVHERVAAATSAPGTYLVPGAVASPFAEGTGAAITPVALVYDFVDLLTASANIVGYRGYAPTGGFSTFPSACGTPPAFTRTGSPWLGSTVQFQLATAFPLVGIVFGTPDSVSLAPICSCVLAVNGTIVVGNTLAIAIPPTVSLVGQTFSAQGFTFELGPCFGSASLTDTFDMVVQ